jgi:hypothetical protein
MTLEYHKQVGRRAPAANGGLAPKADIAAAPVFGHSRRSAERRVSEVEALTVVDPQRKPRTSKITRRRRGDASLQGICEIAPAFPQT